MLSRRQRRVMWETITESCLSWGAGQRALRRGIAVPVQVGSGRPALAGKTRSLDFMLALGGWVSKGKTFWQMLSQDHSAHELQDAPNTGGGHGSYTNQPKSNKVRAGCATCCSSQVSWSEMQANHKEPLDEENPCRDSLIATYSYLIIYPYHRTQNIPCKG